LTIHNDSLIVGSTISSLFPEKFDNNQAIQPLIYFEGVLRTGIELTQSLTPQNITIVEEIIGSITVLINCNLIIEGRFDLSATLYILPHGTIKLNDKSLIVITSTGIMNVLTAMYVIATDPTSVAIVNQGLILINTPKSNSNSTLL